MPRKSSGEVFVADEQDFLAFGGGFDGTLGVHIQLAGGRTGAGGKTAGDTLRGLYGFAVKDGRKHLVELVGGDAADGGLPIISFFLLHLDGEADGSQAGAFAVAGLEHEHFAVLDGELEVLDILEVRFEGLANVANSWKAAGMAFWSLATGSGVRTPATTSSPWALMRNSP